MARPKKQTVDYFPHSCTHKKTMFIIEQRFGNDGYAFWFKLLETLGNNEGHYIDLRNEEEREFLSSLTRIEWDKCAEILELLAKLGAIDKEFWNENIVWSDNFIENIKDAYRYRVVDIPDKPYFLLNKSTSDGVSDTRNPQSILNKIKVDNTIINNTKKTPPDDDNKTSFKKIIKAFNDNIHPITPMEAEELEAWLKDGIEPALIVWAIKQAVTNGKRNAKYINAIIRNLEKDGITTLSGAEAKERDWQDNNKNGSRSRESPAKRKLTAEEKQEIEKLNRQIEEARKNKTGGKEP